MSDCWVTPPKIANLVYTFWPGGIDFDPFMDPAQVIKTADGFNIRNGQDAYQRPWRGRRIWVQGPYSKKNPHRTAEKVAIEADQSDAEFMNLCPASPGSDYWGQWVWPYADAVAWLGRVPFMAGREMRDKKTGEIVCKKGQIRNGNRTEIALVYRGPLAERFKAVWGLHYPTQIL